MHMPHSGTRPFAHGRGEARLNPIVDAIERDEAPVAPRRERGGDGVRLAGPPHVLDPYALGAKASHSRRVESADDCRADAETRSGDRGRHGAAADGRCEARGLDLFAGPRHPRQAIEDQIFERFADGEQIDRSQAGHARKV